jgi:ABC-type uncharacterized transport system substrate-binding protein
LVAAGLRCSRSTLSSVVCVSISSSRPATYVDRILKGADRKTCRFRRQQPETVSNLKTAKALNIVVSAQLLARADEVIE